MHILRCTGSKFCVKSQRVPLKFHTEFWTHIQQNMHFTVFNLCVWVTISLNCDVISLRTTCHFRWPCAIFADTGVFKIRITILKSMQFVAFLWDFSQITSNHQSNTKNSMELFGGKLKVPWNSMEFHGTRECGKSSMDFHGTLDLDKIPWNSMEFHGTTDVVQMLFKKFHGTLEKVPWNFLTKKFQWALKRDFEWYFVT